MYSKSSSQLIFINAPLSLSLQYKSTGNCKLRRRILQGIPFQACEMKRELNGPRNYKNEKCTYNRLIVLIIQHTHVHISLQSITVINVKQLYPPKAIAIICALLSKKIRKREATKHTTF